MIYVTSDLHGYPLAALQKTLQSCGFSEHDRLYILGDCIDRGTDGIKILRWAMSQPNVIFIRGNHEAMLLENRFIFDGDRILTKHELKGLRLRTHLQWTSNGGQSTIRELEQYTAAQIKHLLQYVERAPLCCTVTVNGTVYILTHSGLGNFSPDKPLTDYIEPELIWTRPSLDTEYFKDGKIVIFGHTPTAFYGSMYSGKPIFTDTWINIDVGTALGNAPLLLRLDDMQEFYM